MRYRYISVNGVLLDANKVPVVRSGHSLKFKGKSGSSPTPPPPQGSSVGGGDVIIKVKFNSVPTTATSTFTKLKYGKSAMVHLEEDGSQSDFLSLVNYLQGGGPAADGTTYSGKTFTDGCGNTKYWTAAVACNIHSNSDDAEIMNPSVAPGLSAFDYTVLPDLVQKGCFPIPHGYYLSDIGAGSS